MEDIFIKKDKGTLVEVHIADIHFGVINPLVQYNILRDQFIAKIYEMNKVDIVSINGDLFDHKFMSNSDVIMYASMFINELVNICKLKNSTLVIIHGTAYHDASQLKLFYHYINDPSIDIRIVENIQFEIIKGARILCIPETYGLGEDYYRSFLFNSGEYDSVFMHGVIKGAIYEAKNQESGMHTDKAPTFTIDDFMLCRGPMISGHVHTSGCFDKYFYYCGSPIRWQFGEENVKGFLIVIHNLETHEHYTHLEPINSFIYKTVDLSDLLNSDPSNIINEVNNLQSQGVDYVRLNLTIVNEVQKTNLEILKKYYRNSANVKLKINKNKNDKESMDESVLGCDMKYDYILDKSLSEHEILTRYINDNKGYNYITVEELKQIINEG